jgi:alkylation response protein AidB-like acyl-CoA dehydrogenase
MIYPLTERQQGYLALAQELAANFAQRAPQHDRAGTFPHENYADIRASGLPALVVPVEDGGWGGGMLDAVLVTEALGMGDGSTALSMTMHFQTLGGALEKRSWPEPILQELCRAAVERGALVNAIASEPELGSPSRGGKPKTTARPIYEAGRDTPTAWIINGRKNFASMIPELDFMILLVTLADGSDQVAHFVVPPGEGVEIVESWDALGMRSTGSHDVIFHDVRVPHSAFIPPAGSAKSPTEARVNAWFPLCVSAAYLGVAGAAQRAAVRYAKERVPTALGKPIAEIESIQRHLGQTELLLRQARLQLYQTADLWSRFPERRAELGPNIWVAKYTATNTAIAVVDHCMRVAGGAGMTKALPLERYYRDVRGGLNHPMNDDQALVLLGQQAIQQM